MRKRNIKVNVYLNENEKKMLEEKSSKVKLSQSDFLRMLIQDFNIDKRTKNIINIDCIVDVITENINYLINVKNRFHYLGYYQDEETLQIKIDYLKKISDTMLNNIY